MLYVFLVYFYLATRFNGSFIEADTLGQSRVIYGAQVSNSLISATKPYSNGYVYTAISVFVLNITGISLHSLQLLVFPLLSILLVPTLYVTYRLFIGNTKIALFGTFLMFLQPDFLFVTWRGSHERFTWLFTLLLLFCILKTFVFTNRLTLVVRFMLIFYLVSSALISINDLFASSFMTGLIVSFIGGYVVLWVHNRLKFQTDPRIKNHILRMLYIAVSFSVFTYVFIFYLYPPAKQSLLALGNLVSRVSVLVLSKDQTSAFDPFATFVSFPVPVFLALSAFSWIVLGISAIGWLKQGRTYLHRSVATNEELPRFFLWLSYASYAALLVAAVLSDRSGGLSGNLQTRIFTPLNLLVMPLAALTIWEAFSRLNTEISRRIFMVVGVVAIIWFSGASVIKASVDPLLSNKWTFATDPELKASNWVVSHVPFGSNVWTGFDERLVVGFYFDHLDINEQKLLFYDWPNFGQGANYAIFSTVEALRWIKIGRPLPDLESENRIYDNGTAVVYRRRPRTTF